MVAAEREHAKAAQQVEIAVVFTIKEVLSASLAKAHIIPDGLENADHLLIEAASVEVEAVGLVSLEQRGDVGVKNRVHILCRSRGTLWHTPNRIATGQQCGRMVEIPPETNSRPAR